MIHRGIWSCEVFRWMCLCTWGLSEHGGKETEEKKSERKQCVGPSDTLTDGEHEFPSPSASFLMQGHFLLCAAGERIKDEEWRMDVLEAGPLTDPLFCFREKLFQAERKPRLCSSAFSVSSLLAAVQKSTVKSFQKDFYHRLSQVYNIIY